MTIDVRVPPSDDIRRELARRGLIEYVRMHHPSYRAGIHHCRIAEKLEAVERGEIRRLMISAPPRHGKTMLASENFPAWYLGRNPDRYIIHASYAQELAEDFGRKIRNQMQDGLHRQIFPGCVLADDSASQKRLTTTMRGAYYALGVGGPATGRGAHLLLIDDPTKGREDADSETYRRRLKDWYRAVAYTRLMPGGAVVIILTRWHHDDLAGWLLREHASEGWEVVNLPAVAKDDDQLGRKPGEALWPDDYPLDALSKIKDQIGSREWASLYQQEPSPDEGSVFKLEWFPRYTTLPADVFRCVHSWDTADKDKEINDPTSLTAWTEAAKGYYLKDRFNARLQFPDLLRAIRSLAERDGPDAILIEDKASGQQAIQVLRRETRLPIIAVEPDSSKVIRAQGVSGMCEAGRVWLPSSAPWLVDYEMQIRSFPQGAHDDDVDSTSQALSYFARTQAHKATLAPLAIPQRGAL